MTPRLAPLALVVLAAAIGAHAQSPAASPLPPPPRAAVKPPPAPPVFEGLVTGPDEKPIARATVVVSATTGTMFEPPLVARTGEDGRFRIPARRSAPHALRVEAAGLAAATIERAMPGAPVRVRLARGGAIEGVVRDATSREPVAGARVEARAERGAPVVALDPSIGVVATRTDAKGVFRLEGLAPGPHVLVASSRSGARGTRPGVGLGQRVELLLVSGAALTGLVRTPEGAPLAGAAVRVEPEAGPGSNRTVATEADGRFEIGGLTPGLYRAIAHHRDRATAVVGGLRVERGTDADVEITLAPPVRVVGRLVDDKGRPVPGTITVQEIDGVPLSPNPATAVRAEADADGRFALTAIPPGAHTLAVTGRAMAPRRVPVEVGGRQSEVDLGEVVLESGAQLRGRVRSAAGPVADAIVRAFPSGRVAGMSFLEDRTEADGTFALGGAEPGAYELSVEAPGFAPEGRRVEAPAEGVEVVVQPAGSIRGTVVDAAGRPVEAFEVGAMPGGAREDSRRPMPRRHRAGSPDGTFALDDLAAGAYVLRVSAGDLGRAVVSDVVVRAGAVTDAGRIRLAPAGVVRGAVVDAGGNPVAGATVEARGAERFSFAADRAESVTDGAGRFELGGLAPGRVVVAARHPEYATGASAPVDVDPARPAETSITLTRGGRIEGVVRWRSPAPAERAWIMARSTAGPDMSGPPPPAAFPGPDGRFAIERVTPGRVHVSLMVTSAGGSRGSGLFKEVDVREGETAAVEFTWREILLRGRVTRGGAPLANVRLTASGPASGVAFGGGPWGPAPQAAGPQRLTAVTREDGSYEMIVGDAGRTMIAAEALAGGVSYPARAVEIADADTVTVDIDFPATGVAGVVVDEATGAPVGGAFVFAMPMRAGTRGGGRATTGADGRFQIDSEPGDYKLRVAAEGYASESVDASVGEEPGADVRVALSRGGRLRGRIVDERGRPAAGVSVVARDERTEAMGHAQAAFDGTFEIAALRPGTYILMAGSGMSGFGMVDGVSPGPDEVVVRLSPGGRVRVTVTGADGAPVEGAYVRVRTANGVTFTVPTLGGGRTTANGAAELDAPAGAVEVEARKDALRGTATATVPAGGVAAAAVTLTAVPPPPGR